MDMNAYLIEAWIFGEKSALSSVAKENRALVSVDGGKNPSQQRETLLISQDPIRLTNVWYGRLDGIMDLLPF